MCTANPSVILRGGVDELLKVTVHRAARMLALSWIAGGLAPLQAKLF